MARRFAPGGTPQSPSLDRAEARQAPAAPESEPDLTPGEAPQPESSPLPVRRPAASDVHRLPSLNLLNRSTSSKPAAARAQALQRGQGRLLEDALAEFGVAGRITATRPGPVVTAYDLEPARTVRPQRVVALAEEIARAIGVTSLRVAPDPERPMIVIEVPNVHPDEIALRELLDSDAFRRGAATLPLALGRSSKGEPVIADLSRMTGLLVAGAPGSGKTAGLNAMVLSLLFKLGPAELKLVLFDPRMLELSVYGGLPHLIAPVIAEPWQALAALDWAVREMDERQKRMAAVNMRGIDAFNNAIANARRQGLSLGRRVQTGFDRRTGEPLYEVSTIDSDPLPRIVVVIEELAELMLGCGREVEAALQRLAAGGRASGIHVIAATQRPTPDVLTGAILGALPQRLCYRVASRTDSRTVLGEDGAELLLGLGDHLYADGEGGTALRVHGPHVAEEEAERVAAELSRQARPDFLADVTAAAPRMAPVLAARPAPTLEDGVYERALAIHARDAGIGVRALAARLGIGADRAAEIMARIAREAA
jgi:S-DNA-T family DNA segregation ATPase FtsK/SpoIIIE